METKFKIGDEVSWLFGGGIYIIMATKNEPHLRKNMPPVFPNIGTDYLIIPKELPKDEITPFSHANEVHLELADHS